MTGYKMSDQSNTKLTAPPNGDLVGQTLGETDQAGSSNTQPKTKEHVGTGVSASEKGSSCDKGHGRNKDGRRDDGRDSSRNSKEKGKDDETQMALKLMAQSITQLSGNITKFMANAETKQVESQKTKQSLASLRSHDNNNNNKSRARDAD